MYCKIALSTLGSFLCAVFITATASAQEAQQAKLAEAITTSENAFGLTLLSTLSDNTSDTENIFISPLSISQAIGLLYIGSAGTTKNEIAQAMHLTDVSDKDFNSINRQLLDSMRSPTASEQTTVANAIWSQAGEPFGAKYKEECKTYFDAEARSVDFHHVNEAAEAINSWVATNTAGKIKQLITPNAIDGAQGVLTNAVYFRGDWLQTFDTALTAPAPFTLADGSVVSIPTMKRNGRLLMYSDPDFTLLSLPYAGSPETSMTIILPQTGHTLAELMNNASKMPSDLWTSQLSSVQATLFLPRFHADFSCSLTNACKQLGITQLFTSYANLSPMGLSKIHVSDVIHKAVVDVDERGTVAAAASGVIIRSLAIRAPLVVRVDHPFFCAIRRNDTGALLFIGMINQPKSAE